MAKPPLLAYQHWQRIIRLWPIDRIRPEKVSFQHVMQRRLQKLHADPNSNSNSSSPSTSPLTPVKANDALVSPATPATPSTPQNSAIPQSADWNEAHELRQTNALYSLLENRYAGENPLPQNLRRPKFNPDYYDEIAREMREAPDRSWFQSWLKRVKGTFRFT